VTVSVALLWGEDFVSPGDTLVVVGCVAALCCTAASIISLSVLLGRKSSNSIFRRVVGELWLTKTHSVMALRSYEVPLGHTTGSVINSKVMGQ
jgi:hypothetical protein